MKIYVNTVLGSPAAACAHFGICKVESLSPATWASFKPTHFRQTKGLLSASSSTPALLKFSFHLPSMHAETYPIFFSSGIFQVDAPYWLPDQLSRRLKYPPGIVLLPGQYPVSLQRHWAVLQVAFEWEPSMVQIQNRSTCHGLG